MLLLDTVTWPQQFVSGVLLAAAARGELSSNAAFGFVGPLQGTVLEAFRTLEAKPSLRRANLLARSRDLHPILEGLIDPRGRALVTEDDVVEPRQNFVASEGVRRAIEQIAHIATKPPAPAIEWEELREWLA